VREIIFKNKNREREKKKFLKFKLYLNFLRFIKNHKSTCITIMNTVQSDGNLLDDLRIRFKNYSFNIDKK
jgi:hypothetical protein